MFWKASKATTEQHFNAAMKEIQLLSQAAFQHLMDRNPKTWSRAFFQEGRGCDAVENGISESFNNLILDARKKPIITMREEIRIYVMERVHNMNVKGSNWDNHMVCPNIRTILNDLGKLQRYWQVLPCGYNQFEARNMMEAYTVDLEKKTCACRLWQLNGIGCVHSIATIAYLNKDVDGYVDPLFLGTFYKNNYKYPVLGMNGSNMWHVTDFIPPLPPLKRKMPGRPTIKRKRDANERRGKHRVSKLGKRVLCSVCKQTGHNKITCPQNQPPTTTKNANKQNKRKCNASSSGVKEKGQNSHAIENVIHRGEATYAGDNNPNPINTTQSQTQPESQVSSVTPSVMPPKRS